MQIVYSIPDQENPFWRQVISGAERKAKAEGASIEVIGAAHDENKQAEQLVSVLRKKPDAVLVSPVQTRTIAAACRAIRDSGIPIVAVDQNMTTDVTASVISGNLRGGMAAAQHLVQRLGPGKRVVHLQAEAGLENVVLRRNSFINEINRGGLRIVKEIQGFSSRPKAREGMRAFLSEGAGFDAVFGENDAMALGAVDALADRKFSPWPPIVGFDGVPEALDAIRAGRMEATVAQNPAGLGEKSVELAFRIIRRMPFEELTSVLPKLVTVKDLK
jgi:ABC-type sugar transport system substrate-binding protein